MPRLLVVHHTSPALQAMFEAAVSGTRTDEIEGIEVVVRPALTAAAVDVLEADGHLLGTQLTPSSGDHGGPADQWDARERSEPAFNNRRK